MESNSKTEIYNRAANLGYIPKFETQVGSRRSKRTVTVTISIAELGVSATATALTLGRAEIEAATGFKRLIEAKSVTKDLQNLPLQYLSTETARSFIEFYQSSQQNCIINMHSNVDVPVTRSSDERDLQRHAAVVSINGHFVGEEVYLESSKKAQDVAYLTTALTIVKQDPELLYQFREHSQRSAETRRKPVDHLELQLEPDTLRLMRAASESFHTEKIAQATKPPLAHEQSAGYEPSLGYEQLYWEPEARTRELSAEQRNERRNVLLQRRQTELETRTAPTELQKKADLPLRQHGSRLLGMINDNQYCIVAGATGCGKTTQLPQLLLEQAIASGQGTKCNIICTQPRRIAAKSVAKRVAQERKETLQNTVGYHVRFESKPPIPGGSIKYCTTGILLSQLERNGDSVLDGLSHIILDEVHERDMLIDFLMVVLKKSVASRRQANKSSPKVVLMSATVDTELFANYFENISPYGEASLCPSISVPGRLFPVEHHFLHSILAELRDTYKSEFDSLMNVDRASSKFIAAEESFPSATNSSKPHLTRNDDGLSGENDTDQPLIPIHLIGAMIAHIAKRSSTGAILVFLPGLEEIRKVERLLRLQPIFGVDFRHTQEFRMIMLHSALPEAQNEVFETVPPGCRKIILATNIAETSITIPDVRFIVDTGKLRENRYSQVHRINRLLMTWESKSNAKQRAGRAGRVQNGHYFGLFSQARYESFATVGLPEMLRTDLQSICLSVKLHAKNASIKGFLADALQPPTAEAVDAAIKSLQNLQALSEDEELTPLGRVLARLPVHPTLGKMIVLGVIFKCLDPMLVVGAAHSERPLLAHPIEEREAANSAQAEYFEATRSDQVALINAFRELRQIRDEQSQIYAEIWARRKYLHFGAFTMIDRTTQQIEDVLVEAGLIPRTTLREREYSEIGGPQLNENAGNVAIVKALLVAGFAPNLAVKSSKALFRTAFGQKAVIHPGSTNSGKKKQDNELKGHSVVTYAEMIKSSDGKTLLLRDTTLATPLMALLFGGRLRTDKPGVIQTGQWLSYRVQGDRSVAWDLIQFRNALDEVRNRSKRRSSGYADFNIASLRRL